MSIQLDKLDKKNLKKRYLIWLYKTLKEKIDMVERKFTQLEIDKVMLGIIKCESKKYPQDITKNIEDFEKYIRDKEKIGLESKFDKGQIKSNYLFLLLKFQALQKTIVSAFGKPALTEIRDLYEKEMTTRILEADARNHS